MHTIKARKIGNSIGVTLPKELLDHFGIREGDTLFAGSVDEGICLSPYDPAFEAAMAAFEETRREFRNALKALAK
ncbi:MAG: AbrB/MazE/SpoVT family DNA-binding domain-containing protein [Gammaproteobacteria bacterium]|nr:AbrB/MazE/SpoVT family DNA-binding domain-containing protein [Gammaproteobacteria bacterium]